MGLVGAEWLFILLLRILLLVLVLLLECEARSSSEGEADIAGLLVSFRVGSDIGICFPLGTLL